MARISHSTESSGSSNPTSKYLQWKSNDQSFSYYDKEQGKNIEVGLPTKFVFLQHYHTVKGWHDASESGIYSNEVFYIGSEPMTVRSFKGGTIAEGKYKDIKPQVVNAGGKYHRSIYVMLEDGSIANISLKGAAVRQWSDFIDQSKSAVDGKWIEVLEAKQEKKGSIKYSVPEFTLGADIKKKEDDMANNAASQLKEYLDKYFSKDSSEEVEEEEFDLEF
jgi:hypothetical protein